MIPTHLKVLTIVERPFIYIRNKTFGVSCEEEREGEGWVECPEHVDSPGVGASFCCRGYCMDLLEELSRTSNFTYSLHVSLRGDYGNLERNNDTGKQVGRTESTYVTNSDPCISGVDGADRGVGGGEGGPHHGAPDHQPGAGAGAANK